MEKTTLLDLSLKFVKNKNWKESNTGKIMHRFLNDLALFSEIDTSTEIRYEIRYVYEKGLYYKIYLEFSPDIYKKINKDVLYNKYKKSIEEIEFLDKINSLYLKIKEV